MILIHESLIIYSAPHFLDRRIKWKFIHPLKLKNEQEDLSAILFGLQDEGLPRGPEGTRDHRGTGKEVRHPSEPDQHLEA